MKTMLLRLGKPLGLKSLFLGLSIFVYGQGTELVPVQAVPDFTFFRLDNNVFGKKDMEPGKMLFFLFFDSDCEHCQRAMINLNQNFQQYRKLAIYLVTLDGKEKIGYFLNKYGQNLKNKKNVVILQDLRNEFISKFRPRKYPSMFLFSPANNLIDYEDNEESMFRFLNFINSPPK
jgi:thiol-disulfide isomerase/thioredoxin